MSEHDKIMDELKRIDASLGELGEIKGRLEEIGRRLDHLPTTIPTPPYVPLDPCVPRCPPNCRGYLNCCRRECPYKGWNPYPYVPYYPTYPSPYYPEYPVITYDWQTTTGCLPMDEVFI